MLLVLAVLAGVLAMHGLGPKATPSAGSRAWAPRSAAMSHEA